LLPSGRPAASSGDDAALLDRRLLETSPMWVDTVAAAAGTASAAGHRRFACVGKASMPKKVASMPVDPHRMRPQQHRSGMHRHDAASTADAAWFGRCASVAKRHRWRKKVA
jgi:hypothetical protein